MSANRSNTVVVPFREIDVANSAQLLDLLNSTNGSGALSVDMHQVDFVDSSGIRALFMADEARRDEHGAGIRLTNMTPAVKHVLELCDLFDHFG